MHTIEWINESLQNTLLFMTISNEEYGMQVIVYK